jgi:dTDP-4-amino-4,6-dideoxygalactose transaminase
MKDAAMRVLERGSSVWGHMGRGQEITFFESEFAFYCGGKNAILLDSVFRTIYLLLRLRGISGKDEVIVAPHIEPGVAGIVEQAGARSAFVDIEAETFNIDVTKIEKRITSDTKAILVATAQGHPANMDPIMEIAEKHSLYVIEDSTHATGGKYRGRRLPVGHAGVFGLSNKCLWLPGGPAMLVTDDKETVEKLRVLRNWEPGRRGPEAVKDLHGKGIVHVLKIAPNDVDAAIGRVQLRHLDEYINMQRSNASTYTELLKNTPVITPIEKDYAHHVFLRYVIRTEKRDALREYLAEKGIECHVLYPTPAHLYEYYQRKYGYKKGDFPVSEKMKETELALPEPSKDRTQWEIEYVARNIEEFF